MNEWRYLPGRLGAWSLWAGADHYGFWEAAARAPFLLPLDQIKNVYRVSPLAGDSAFLTRYAVEYRSDRRDCFVLLPELPPELHHRNRQEISWGAALGRVTEHLKREPAVFFLPLAMPFAFFLTLALFGLWNDYVIRNPDLLELLARPGCGQECVRKVLSIHSLVGLLFLLQSLMVFLPVALLLFQAPRFRSALNFRMIQTYSLTSVVIGTVIFVQLLAFFPFRQYGKFVGLGFDPRVERALSNLKNKQHR